MSEPRIVFFDIETLPILRQALIAWPGLSNYPGSTFKASLNSVCCFGYKVMGEEETKTICAWDFPEWKEDVNNDVPLLRKVLEVLEGADAIITQNGKAFDEKFLRTRLLLRNLPDLVPMKHSDTKLLAKKFSFFSNSLRYLAEQLTDSRKIDNEGWPLWIKTYDRVPEACETMRTYCAGDVDALEAIYRKLRRAAGGKNAMPNHNLFNVAQGGAKCCPECGSTRLNSNGVRRNQTVTYRRYQCQDCGSWSRTDLSDRLPRSL